MLNFHLSLILVSCLPMSVEYELKYITYVFQREKENDQTFPLFNDCSAFAFLEVNQ
jgi:hypothetical protein